MKAFYRENKGLHRWLFACGAVLVLFYMLCASRAAANFWVCRVSLPFEQLCGRACAALPFSVAELLYVLAAVTAGILLVRVGRLSANTRKKRAAARRLGPPGRALCLPGQPPLSPLWGGE